MMKDVVDRDNGGGTVGTADFGHGIVVADGRTGDREEDYEGGDTGGSDLADRGEWRPCGANV